MLLLKAFCSIWVKGVRGFPTPIFIFWSVVGGLLLTYGVNRFFDFNMPVSVFFGILFITVTHIIRATGR